MWIIFFCMFCYLYVFLVKCLGAFFVYFFVVFVFGFCSRCTFLFFIEVLRFSKSCWVCFFCWGVWLLGVFLLVRVGRFFIVVFRSACSIFSIYVVYSCGGYAEWFLRCSVICSLFFYCRFFIESIESVKFFLSYFRI